MNLIETIRNLNVNPRHQGDEYEYTSDFLEWFYYNIVKENIENYDIITLIKSNPEHNQMYDECLEYININNAKNYDDQTLKNKYENMKQWLINNINNY